MRIRCQHGSTLIAVRYDLLGRDVSGDLWRKLPQSTRASVDDNSWNTTDDDIACGPPIDLSVQIVSLYAISARIYDVVLGRPEWSGIRFQCHLLRRDATLHKIVIVVMNAEVGRSTSVVHGDFVFSFT